MRDRALNYEHRLPVCLPVAASARASTEGDWLWLTMDDADGAWDRVAVLHFEYSCEAAQVTAYSSSRGLVEGRCCRKRYRNTRVQERTARRIAPELPDACWLGNADGDTLQTSSSSWPVAPAPVLFNFPFLFAPFFFFARATHVCQSFEAMSLSRPQL
jgi:hypothetical protein